MKREWDTYSYTIRKYTNIEYIESVIKQYSLCFIMSGFQLDNISNKKNMTLFLEFAAA